MARCNLGAEHLAEYLDGTVSPAESQQIEAHLATGCSSCQKHLTTLRQTTNVVREVFAASSQLPSDEARAFARNLVRLRFNTVAEQGRVQKTNSADPRVIPIVSRWIAQLIPSQLPFSVGTRSPWDSVSGQLFYETSDHLVTLWEESNAGNQSSYVIGQVYSRQENICLQPETVLFTAIASGKVLLASKEDNEFHVSSLPSGSYVVHCWLNESDVLMLPDVAIGSA